MTAALFPNAIDRRTPIRPGSTAELIATFDWASGPLGAIGTWPEALRAAVRMIVFARMPMCLLVGPQGVLIYNDGYATIAGGRHPEVLGMPALQAWPEVASFNTEVIARTNAGESLSFTGQHMRLNRDGELRDAWFDLNYSPVPGPDGTPLAVLAILAETTPLVQARRTLDRRSEQLSLALAASGAIGIWDWDIANDLVTADVRFAEMYGIDPNVAAEGAPLSAYVHGVYREDRPRLQQAIDAALDCCGEFHAEYRIRGSDDRLRWVMATGHVIASPEGNAVRLPGAVIDITDRKLQEAALAASEASFRTLADAMPQMVWSTLPDGHHDYYNARWYEFTGVKVGSTDGDGWNEVFHADDREHAWTVWRRSLATGEPYEIEYRLRHHSGQYRWTLGRALPLRDPEGRITRWIGTCTDIHDTKLAAEEREVVAQELSHRIKNIFSVLVSIIGLSARSNPTVRPFAEQLRARIAAMGKAHDLVRPHSRSSRPRPFQPSLAALVAQLVDPFQTPDSERILYRGDDVPIDEAAATPLALLFHELATNAAKYGALAQPDGLVEIVSRSEDDRLHLRWSERGQAPTEPPAAMQGFGTRLIQLSVEGQLGGSVTRRWEPNGLVVEIVVPKAALNRSGQLGR